MVFIIKYFSFNSAPKKGKREGREEERERKMSDNNKNRESISKCVKGHISLHGNPFLLSLRLLLKARAVVELPSRDKEAGNPGSLRWQRQKSQRPELPTHCHRI